MQPLSMVGLMTISDAPQGRTVRAAEAGRFNSGLYYTIPLGLALEAPGVSTIGAGFLGDG